MLAALLLLLRKPIYKALGGWVAKKGRDTVPAFASTKCLEWAWR